MKGPSPIPRLLAAPGTMVLAILGMLVLAAAARDVPQGETSIRVLETFGRGIGPFVVLFGLHHLGTSFFLWAAFVLLGLHLWATELIGQRETGGPILSRRLWVVPILLALIPASQWAAREPDPLRDPIRIEVQETGGQMPPRKVEEGAVYRIPGTERTVIFGALGIGPWAGETGPDGALRLHLPRPLTSEAEPSFQVTARRPEAIEAKWRPRALGSMVWSLSLAATLPALALLWALAAPRRRNAASRSFTMGVLGLFALTILGPLWIGPSHPTLPLVSRDSGAPLWFSALVRTPQDLVPWVGVLPVRVPGRWPHLLLPGSLGVLALLALLAWCGRPQDPRSYSRVLRVAGIASLAASLLPLGWALWNPPTRWSPDSIQSLVETEILSRVPAPWAVLETHLGAPPPWSFSRLALILQGLWLLALGGTLLRAGGPASDRVDRAPLGPLAGLLVVFCLLQALGGVLAAPSGLWPEALVPSSLLAAALAGTAWSLLPSSAARPGNPSGVLLCAASLIQVSLAF